MSSVVCILTISSGPPLLISCRMLIQLSHNDERKSSPLWAVTWSAAAPRSSCWSWATTHHAGHPDQGPAYKAHQKGNRKKSDDSVKGNVAESNYRAAYMYWYKRMKKLRLAPGVDAEKMTALE